MLRMTQTQEGQEFTKLLHSRVECSMFRSFVKKSACDENLMFWIEIELHKKEIGVFVGSFKVEYARKRNEEIFNKYFKVGGDHELNLDSDAVDEIREKLFQGSEEEANSFHLFNRAQDEVYLLMLNDSFAKFKKSNEFLQYQQKLESSKGKHAKKPKKKSGSYLGSPSSSSSDESIRKRSSISSLSKLFSKPKHVHAKDIPIDDTYTTKLNEAPVRRTFSGLNHQEITETPQSTWDSMKIRPRANSLEEIEILEKSGSAPTSPRSKHKRGSIVRSRIRHSINSLRSLFSNSSRENLRSPSAPAVTTELPRSEGNRIRSSTEAARPKSRSSPAIVHQKTQPQSETQSKAELPRSPSDLIFDAFFLSSEPVVAANVVAPSSS